MGRNFTWIATGGGAWSLAANWDDVSDRINPSLLAPGPLDSVDISGPTGSIIQTMTTQGSVLEANFTGNSALSGTFAASALTLGEGGSGGLLEVLAGSMAAATLTVAAGSMLASGSASAISVAGLLTVGSGQSGFGAGACNLDATAGGTIRAGTLQLDASSAVLYVDPTSTLEIGAIGGAAPGILTVDNGAILSGQGSAAAYGAITNNGTILAAGGELMLGTLGGLGMLQIGAGAVLDLNGAAGAGQAVQFTGTEGTLALSTEFDAPLGTISLFAAGDVIDVLGSPISAATYKGNGIGGGVLTLWYGGLVADQLILAGSYAGDVFLATGDGALGTLITVAPQTQGGGNASPGTSTPDVYQWITDGGGNWLHAGNWTDITASQTPAHIAPGMNNIVTIDGSDSGSFEVIAGPANAASLTIEGNVALSGAFAIGTLSVGSVASLVSGVLDLLPRTTVNATSAQAADGAISVSGSAVLAVAGALDLGSRAALAAAALAVTAGGTVTAASLTLLGGSGNNVTTDPTAVIEIGSAGNAVAGAVTVDAGAEITGNGSLNPYGAIVDNGTIDAEGGVLTVGAVTGSGVLTVGANAVLELISGNAMAIGFAGAGGSVKLNNELVSLTGTLSGFAAADAIDIQNDPITGIGTAMSGTNTVLSLYYGSTLVNQLTLAGSFTGSHFVLAPDGADGTDILLSGNGGGGGNGGGQGATDLLTWAVPGSGAWISAGNWFDANTGAPALAAPGAQNQVQIVGPTGIAIQTIGGPGLCASLGLWNNTQLSNNFIAGTLSIGGTLGGILTSALVQVNNSASLTATVLATVADGTLAIGNTGLLSIAGTLSVGDGAPGDNGAYSLLTVSNNGTAQMAALTLGGGVGASVQTDANGVVEVGSVGAAAAGAVTVDNGAAISGSGYVNLGGLVVDNGRITAVGGTLVLGATSGLGTLAVGAEATLALTAVETCTVTFAGGGATLLLPGSEQTPSAPILGFVDGDAIVTGSSQVSSVQFSPGAGGVGTLTMYNGSRVAGQLLLGGDFAGQVFSVQPDGNGSEINVQDSLGGGPSQGTPTPDAYQWLGGDGPSWNTAGNWQDITTGQKPASIAPGSQNLVTVQGGTGGTFTTINGPADASALVLYGNVALAGTYTIGTLSVGGPVRDAVLALGQGATLLATSAVVYGNAAVQSGDFATSAALTLTSGALVAGADATVQAGSLVLTGAGDVITVDGTSSLEVGNAGQAAAGMVTVDAGAILSGAGALDPTGSIADSGTITASGGTLSLGAVSGSGTLLVGVGATLALDSTAAATLLVDFAGSGTLSALAAPAADIANFGDGDQIFLGISGVTDTEYAPTAPNLGVLTLLGSGTVLGTLNLVGVGAGQSFLATAAGNGTIITTQTTDWGGGGGTMRNGQTDTSGGTFGVVQDFGFWAALPTAAQDELAMLQAAHGNEAWVDTSTDGSSWDDPAVAVANFAVVSDPTPHSIVGLPIGYDALLAQGYNPVWLADAGAGNVLLVGNGGNDTISGTGANDTLVAAGGNTVFFANYAANIYGAGNDTIITGQGNSRITTSQQGHSVVFLGASSNNVVSQGHDTVLASAGPGANDTIWAVQSDTIFAASVGLTTIITGNGPSAVIANPGQIHVDGGNGNGSVVFCDASSVAAYVGGAGSAEVIGGSGFLSVQGGAGAVTVFGGSGANLIEGAAGPSFYLVGEGASTVSAASGNHVWLAGAANDSLVASGGNIILWGANSTGNNVFQAGNGPVTMSGGFGNDTLIGGSGAAEMLGGFGNDVFTFTNGLSGGSDTIGGFNVTSDRIILHGYAGYSSAVVGGNEVISLSDGTHIMLTGISSMAGVNITLG